MDNIKKFEDFLDRMQGLLDSAKKQGHIIVRVEDLENTFPELRESEDEKIRKWIKKELENKYVEDGIVNNVLADKAFAWLEKQGEKPIGICSGHATGKLGEIIKDIEAEPFDKYEGLTDFERTLADICIGWIGKEYGWKQYIKDNADILLKIAVEKFNSVQDATFEQKPADWSEEDERNWNNIWDVLDGRFELSDYGYKEAAKWFLENCSKGLKSLRQQPKQEWSEEDEKMFCELSSSLLINISDQWVKYGKWLKSLKGRITWKPTEAQLASLTIACDRNDRIGFDLTQLLEELKKL